MQEFDWNARVCRHRLFAIGFKLILNPNRDIHDLQLRCYYYCTTCCRYHLVKWLLLNARIWLKRKSLPPPPLCNMLQIDSEPKQRHSWGTTEMLLLLYYLLPIPRYQMTAGEVQEFDWNARVCRHRLFATGFNQFHVYQRRRVDFTHLYSIYRCPHSSQGHQGEGNPTETINNEQRAGFFNILLQWSNGTKSVLNTHKT